MALQNPPVTRGCNCQAALTYFREKVRAGLSGILFSKVNTCLLIVACDWIYITHKCALG